MEDEVSLISIRQMDGEDCRKLDIFQQIEIMGLYIENYGQEKIREILNKSDYTISGVKIKGKVYKVYHGFPGDNSTGLFILNDNEWYYFGEISHELMQPNVSPHEEKTEENITDPIYKIFHKWYMNITKERTDFLEFVIA